jgi:hypothetical protein
MNVAQNGRKGKLVIPDVSGLTCREAAHAYLDAGFTPVPWVVRRGTKILYPPIMQGTTLNKYTSSHEIIDSWPKHVQVGLLTSRSGGIIAVDIDRPEEFEQWETEADFKTEDTAVSFSGRGGGAQHILYDARKLVNWPTQGPIPGGEVKSNGFIAVAPSLHPSGRPYCWSVKGPSDLIPIGTLGGYLRRYRSTAAAAVSGERASRDVLVQAVLAAKSGEQHDAIRNLVYYLQTQVADTGFIVDYVMRLPIRQYRSRPWTERDIRQMLKRGVVADATDEELAGVRDMVPHEITSDGHISADDIEESSVEWLNWPFLPFGCLVIIDGDPGQGKSLITTGMVAKASSGMPVLPFGRNEERGPLHCGMIGAEDDISHAVKGRLRAAGYAENRHVWFMGLKKDKRGRIELLTFPAGTERVRRFIVDKSLRLLIIDPVSSFLGEDIHSHNEASVRRALAPLADIARDTDCCIVLVRHLNKDGKMKALYRGTGSIAFSAIARSGLISGICPDGTFGLAHVKSSYAERWQGVLRYSIVKWDKDEDIPVIDWQECDEAIDADTLVKGPRERPGPEPTVQDAMVEILEVMFAQKDTWPQKQCITRLAQAGLSVKNPNVIQRVKERLHIRSERDFRAGTGEIKEWVWTTRKIEPNVDGAR